MLLAATTLVLGACATIIIDKLEHYVVVGFGVKREVKPCMGFLVNESRYGLGVAAPCFQPLAEVAIGSTVQVWLKAVHSTDLVTPISGLTVKLDVVTARGVKEDLNAVSPNVIPTSKDGENEERILLTLPKVGIFRVRAQYEDAATRGLSYSPPISALSTSIKR